MSEASRRIETSWVSPPFAIRGFDHLGVQAPSIALYGHLLPGITNVTDRACYFSFYPWLIREFDRRVSAPEDRTLENFCDNYLRPAECLFSLIAGYHEHSSHEDAQGHGVRMVGRGVTRTQATDLDDAAANIRKAAKGYFKNRLGGLGQYYFGPLRDLRILDYADGNRRNPPGYDRRRGTALAEAFEANRDTQRFFETLQSGVLDAAEAAALFEFCPCALEANEADRSALLDLFLARVGPWNDESGVRRRHTLALLLDLVHQVQKSRGINLPDALRGASYAGTLPDGQEWQIPNRWGASRNGWGVYSRGELLTVALQGLFWVSLQHLDSLHGRVASLEALSAGVRDLVLRSLPAVWAEGSVAEATHALASDLPTLQDWQNEGHEVQRANAIVAVAKDKRAAPDTVGRVARDAVLILLTLGIRGFREDPYANFELGGTYSSGDPHLPAFRRLAASWGDTPLSDQLEWLISNWGLQRHLHVALKKLRAQGQDTFRIRPLDNEYRLIEIPPVVYTNPRLGPAVQILRDLGLIRRNDDGSWALTPSGKTELEACRGK